MKKRKAPKKAPKRIANQNSNGNFFAWRQGFADGRLNIPTKDQTGSPQFEIDVKDQAEEYMCALAKQLTDRLSHFTRAISDRAHREGLIKEKLYQANLDLATAQEENREAQEEMRGQEHPHLRPWIVWPIIGVLAFTEVPLNSFVFSLFGGSRTETYLMAAGICFAIPWLAHLAGQESKLREGERVSPKFIAISAVLLVFLLGISYLRTQVMSAMAIDQALNIHVSGFLSGVMFFSANLLIVGAAYWTSYACQVKNPQLFKCREDGAKRAASELESTLENRDSLERELFTLIRNAQDSTTELIKHRNATKSMADGRRAQAKQVIRIYRRSNIRWRKDSERDIASFSVEPVIAEPACLSNAYQEIDNQIHVLESIAGRNISTDNLRVVVPQDTAEDMESA
ncbi:MAG TPA: hypothetical protein VGK02_07685 [Candidatus Aquicultor sp.]|jgi:hypothetical protein